MILYFTTYKQLLFSGCQLNLILVIDASGDVAQLSELARKTIDKLSEKFSQTTFLTILSASSNDSGKAASLQASSNILTDLTKLKDSTRQTPSAYPSDLLSLMKDTFAKSTSSKKTVVFFFGTQSMQYATTVVQQLKQTYPLLNVIAVSSESSRGPNSKDLATLAGSELNVYSSPSAADLADSLKC